MSERREGPYRVDESGMPEQGIDRIEGEFHYAIPHDDDTGTFAVYRKSDDGYVDDGLEGFEKHTIDFLDEQARHHREAALREVDEAAEKFPDGFLIERDCGKVQIYPRATESPVVNIDGTFTQALLAATEGDGGAHG